MSIWHWIAIAIPIGLCGLLLWFIRRKRPLQPGTPAGPPSGVGGWLALLVVGLIVLGPLLSASRINADIIATETQYPALLKVQAWDTYKTATWWTFFATAALSVWAGWVLRPDIHGV